MMQYIYNLVSDDKRRYFEYQHMKNMSNGFDEVASSTIEWLESNEARDFFFNQRGRLSTFMHESGIEERWSEIIERRANTGADITTQIYEYAKKLNMEGDLVRYTSTERKIINSLADSSYELIRNVSNDQIRGIRQALVRDYANGENPRQTSIKDMILEPINGMTPSARAEMIARTETGRSMNTAMLEQYRSDGIQFVTLLTSGDCDECNAYAVEEDGSEKLVPIGEALDAPCIHPNCRCSWVPSTGQMVQ